MPEIVMTIPSSFKHLSLNDVLVKSIGCRLIEIVEEEFGTKSKGSVSFRKIETDVALNHPDVQVNINYNLVDPSHQESGNFFPVSKENDHRLGVRVRDFLRESLKNEVNSIFVQVVAQERVSYTYISQKQNVPVEREQLPVA